MKKTSSIYLSFLFIFFIISCGRVTYSPYPDMPDTGEFSAITYNVAGLPEGINSDQFPSKHMKLISPLMNNYDVVNFQEDFAYHTILYKDLKHPYKTTYEAKVTFGDGLNTVSTIPFVDFTRIKWNQCNGTDCLTPKGFSYCRLRFKEDVYVDLYNVHCNAGSTNPDLAARRNNITQLCAYIETHSVGNAIILMGDFNCRYTRTGDNIRKVDSLGLNNVWVELLRNNVLPLQNDSSLMDCAPNATNATCEVVDKIYYRSSAKITLTPTLYKLDGPEFYDIDGLPISDHRPMNAKFSYKIN